MSELLTAFSERLHESPRRLTPAFDLKVVEAGRMVLARVEGPLDVEHSPAFLARVSPLCSGPRRLVVDLRGAQYLDSAGVRALLRLKSDLEALDGELRLVVRPASRVERTLVLLQLQAVFNTYPSASEAWEDRQKAA